MSELKTKPNDASVTSFVNSIEDAVKKEDSKFLIKRLSDVDLDVLKKIIAKSVERVR